MTEVNGPITSALEQSFGEHYDVARIWGLLPTILAAPGKPLDDCSSTLHDCSPVGEPEPAFHGMEIVASIAQYEYTTIYLAIHQLMDTWVVSTFGFYKRGCFEHSFIGLFVDI